MKIIFENGKLYKIVETKEEINIELEENEELKNKGNNTGHWNTGNRNTGHCNTGDRNTGDYNTGDCNTGYYNTGHRNTGYWNTGHWNTGDRNTGDYNTGHWNTGYRNTGHWNTGYRNTGHWNTGHWNTGDFNIDTPKTIRCFGIEIDRDIWNKAYKPNWLFFNLTEWITEDDMTDEEKENNPTYKTTGGYLKKYDYKEAFKMSYDKASQEDREAVKRLPGFNSDIFYEISGIRL